MWKINENEKGGCLFMDDRLYFVEFSLKSEFDNFDAKFCAVSYKIFDRYNECTVKNCCHYQLAIAKTCETKCKNK